MVVGTRVTNLEIEEKKTLPKRAGFFVSKNVAIVSVIAACTILTGSILATYFGKPNDCDNLGFDSTTIPPKTTTTTIPPKTTTTTPGLFSI